MSEKFIVGSVFHPTKKTFVAACGYNFPDSPELYEFFVIGSNDHFRKRIDYNDEVHPISHNVFDDISRVTKVAG